MDLKNYIDLISNAFEDINSGKFEEALKSLKLIVSSKLFKNLTVDYQLLVKKGLSKSYLNLEYYEEGWIYYTYSWVKKPKRIKELEKIQQQNNSIKYLKNLEQIKKGEKLLIWHEDGGYGDFIYQLRLMKILANSADFKILNGKMNYLLKDRELTVTSAKRFEWHLPLIEIPRVLNYNPIKYNKFNFNYLINPSNINLELKSFVGLIYKTETSVSKSIDYKLLDKLFLKKNNIRFLIIQNKFNYEEVKFFSSFNNVFLTKNIDRKNIFEETYNIINSVKFVISVDTAVGHIAGYLQKRTFLLLNFCGHYYWGYKKKISYDYPLHTIIQQQTKNDWVPVIDDLISSI